MNYGNTSNGTSIRSELQVLEAYYRENVLIIVMNDAFESFEVSGKGGNYTHPGYFLYDFEAS